MRPLAETAAGLLGDARNFRMVSVEGGSDNAELAEATRKYGMGTLNGNFPRFFLQRLGRESVTRGFTHAGAFMQGDEKGTLIRSHFTMGASKAPYNRQVWRINSYILQ